MNDQSIKDDIGYFDYIAVKIFHNTMPFWRKLGITPNMLTTFCIFSSILALYFLYLRNFFGVILFIILRMYFDYVDGMFARKYKMTSKFGDKYDHIGDVLFFIGYIIIIYIGTPNIKTKVIYFSILSIFLISFGINMGCIEKNENNDKKDGTNDSISYLKHFCIAPKIFKYTDNTVVYIVMTVIAYFYTRKF
jgi:phosphatidylserine synthase